MFKEKFNIKKLELYLETSDRGFILLQVNDKKYEQQLIELILKKRKTILYNLKEIDFRQSIELFKEETEKDTIVYFGWDFSEEVLKNLLEKINLSRDFLLTQERLVVFIGPEYIAQIMQVDFPNLYSYFILKEEYITKYPICFEYIFPNNAYLVTKESKMESKSFFDSGLEGIEERLDYYIQKRINKRNFKEFKDHFEEYINRLEEKLQEYEQRYYFSLLLKMANVSVVQEDYVYAIKLYDEILISVMALSQFQQIYYEAVLGKADVCLKQGRYTEAVEEYMSLLMMVSKQHDFQDDGVFYRYIVKIYPRIAICLAKADLYEKAEKYVEIAYEKAMEEENNTEAYAALYNQILILLKLENMNEYEIRSAFEKLNNLCICEIQTAMYLSLHAWYLGVIQGNCEIALKYALESLKLKCIFLNENDIRIAESHYVISVIYFLMDNMEQAHNCKEKCLNILSNYDWEREKISDIQKSFEY